MSQNLFDINNRKFEIYFNQNIEKPWYEWLLLPEQNNSNYPQIKSGKQGYSGVLVHPTNKNLICLYKISKEDDNVVEHEYSILKSLEQLSSYCLHFHKVYGIVKFECNVRLDDQPLIVSEKYKKIEREMMLMQYINNRSSLRELIENISLKDEIIINIMKQIFLIIQMYQDYEFTHYDLHSENILIRDCNPNTFILYVIHNKLYLIPTFGFIPNIIDFGFSYCKPKTKPHSLTCTLLHTKEGYTSSRFDKYVDLKLFLVSTIDDLSRVQERKNIYNKLYNICRNVFSGMNIQWNSGWDNSKIIDPITLVHELIKDYVKESTLLYKSNIWLDGIQQLINLPLSPLPYHELETSCKNFTEEFVKFEERISSKTLLNYILRIFIRIVKKYRNSYISENNEESQWAVLEIKKKFLEEYTQIIKYHIPSINYEKMICSLLLITQCIEGLYYEQLEKIYKEKDKMYEIMRLKTPNDFYNVLDVNFTVEHKKLNPKSTIIVIDHDNRNTLTFSLNKEQIAIYNDIMNKQNNYKDDIPKFLFNIYKSLGK